MKLERRSLRRVVLDPLALALLMTLAAVAPATAEQAAAEMPVFEHASVVMADTPQVLDPSLAALAGMRVAIDPKTGALRAPTAAEIRALDAQSPRRMPGAARSAAAWSIELPDGGVAMALDPELMNFSVVGLAGGGVAFACVDGRDHLGVLATQPASPVAEEK